MRPQLQPLSLSPSGSALPLTSPDSELGIKKGPCRPEVGLQGPCYRCIWKNRDYAVTNSRRRIRASYASCASYTSCWKKIPCA